MNIIEKEGVDFASSQNSPKYFFGYRERGPRVLLVDRSDAHSVNNTEGKGQMTNKQEVWQSECGGQTESYIIWSLPTGTGF